MRPHDAQLLVGLGLADREALKRDAGAGLELLKAHEDQVARALASQQGHPAVVLSRSTLGLAALGALAQDEQVRLKVLPLTLTDVELAVAVPSADGFKAADDLSYRTGRRLKVLVAPETLILDAIAQAHALAQTGAPVWVGEASETQTPHLTVARASAGDAEVGVAALLAGLGSQLAQLRASAEAKPTVSSAVALGAGPSGGALNENTTARLPASTLEVDAGAPEQRERADKASDEGAALTDGTPAEDTAADVRAEQDNAAAPLDRLPDQEDAIDLLANAHHRALFNQLFPSEEGEPVDERKPRVVVIEDEDAIRNLMVKVLEKDGYDVIACADGRAGVEQLRVGRPDLVITDAMLPDVHGFEICSRIKHSDWRDIPVILVSAVYKGLDHAREVQERHGADAFLEKPFQVRLLRDIVANHLGRSLPRADLGTGTRERLAANRDELREASAQGHLEAMKTLLLERVRLDPFDARARAELAGCHERAGELEEALHTYEAAFVYDEGAFDIAGRLAALYGRLGFLRMAKKTWQRALMLAPDPGARSQVERVLAKLDAGG